jgi:hypothetical protein
MLEIGTSGSMSGEGKRGVAEWPKPPCLSSTLPAARRRKDSRLGARRAPSMMAIALQLAKRAASQPGPILGALR